MNIGNAEVSNLSVHGLRFVKKTRELFKISSFWLTCFLLAVALMVAMSLASRLNQPITYTQAPSLDPKYFPQITVCPGNVVRQSKVGELKNVKNLLDQYDREFLSQKQSPCKACYPFLNSVEGIRNRNGYAPQPSPDGKCYARMGGPNEFNFAKSFAFCESVGARLASAGKLWPELDFIEAHWQSAYFQQCCSPGNTTEINDYVDIYSGLTKSFSSAIQFFHTSCNPARRVATMDYPFCCLARPWRYAKGNQSDSRPETFNIFYQAICEKKLQDCNTTPDESIDLLDNNDLNEISAASVITDAIQSSAGEFKDKIRSGYELDEIITDCGVEANVKACECVFVSSSPSVNGGEKCFQLTPDIRSAQMRKGTMDEIRFTLISHSMEYVSVDLHEGFQIFIHEWNNTKESGAQISPMLGYHSQLEVNYIHADASHVKDCVSTAPEKPYYSSAKCKQDKEKEFVGKMCGCLFSDAAAQNTGASKRLCELSDASCVLQARSARLFEQDERCKERCDLLFYSVQPFLSQLRPQDDATTDRGPYNVLKSQGVTIDKGCITKDGYPRYFWSNYSQLFPMNLSSFHTTETGLVEQILNDVKNKKGDSTLQYFDPGPILCNMSPATYLYNIQGENGYQKKPTKRFAKVTVRLDRKNLDITPSAKLSLFFEIAGLLGVAAGMSMISFVEIVWWLAEFFMVEKYVGE